MVKKTQERTLMLRSSSLLNETTGLWPDTTELWLEKHKNTQNTETKRERSSEAAIVGAMRRRSLLPLSNTTYIAVRECRLVQWPPFTALWSRITVMPTHIASRHLNILLAKRSSPSTPVTFLDKHSGSPNSQAQWYDSPVYLCSVIKWTQRTCQPLFPVELNFVVVNKPLNLVWSPE
ncbi:hypothetical protein AMECASPLE_027564 [Ameca splendens]|uniref:Uncharacterized protein n=1 Tax=Ameca splendens TaxID=208324 RepID=A0ABV0Z416_9TELE